MALYSIILQHELHVFFVSVLFDATINTVKCHFFPVYTQSIQRTRKERKKLYFSHIEYYHFIPEHNFDHILIPG